MTRKQFLQDLDKARSNPPNHVQDIERYDGDGISFTYWYSRNGIRHEVELKVVATNIDDYPDGNQYMIFTEDLDVDPFITDTIVQIQVVIDGSSVSTALREISNGLHQATSLGLAENPIPLHSSSPSSSEPAIDDFEVTEPEDLDDDESFGLNDLVPLRSIAQTSNTIGDQMSDVHVEAIKRDLRAAKDAGYKVGVHGDLSKSGIVCISVRIAKLGVSEETMQAWGLLRNQYLVLLVRFQRGYRFLSQVMEEPALSGLVEMRVGLCDTYKPRIEEVFAAFNQVEHDGPSQNTPQPASTNPTHRGSLKNLFIGRPINDLLKDRFPKIVKFRHQFKLHWSGAERLFNDRQGALLSDLSKDIAIYQEPEQCSTARALAPIVLEDSLSHCQAPQASLPLVAIQFVLRHLVRCTEFCLVCHCRVEDTFEALKPYVCSNPLCLYQFMALGFGPAAEWEILSQPYVVDLLVSLCYSQARSSRIREFPLGINLKVPVLPHYETPLATVSSNHHYNNTAQSANVAPTPPPTPARSFKAIFDSTTKTLTPVTDSHTPGHLSVARGDWVVLVSSTAQRPGIHHCRITDKQGSIFTLGTILHCSTDFWSFQTPAKTLDPRLADPRIPVSSAVEVDCYLYDTNFDDLSNQHRHHAIVAILDTLPSVTEMQKILKQQQEGHRDANLNLLRGRCPQAALDLLRWIIASNRSCIMQVDQVAIGTDIEQKLRPSEDRVSGMDDWMQFRFAQGAPDKEQRFVDCVKAKSTSIKHPTLFAWHGSPLYNWHSIIRQGLNFDEILHGRASGHGVYMSPHVTTSMGYMSGRINGPTVDWSNSVLKVGSVVSLQEVVNAPESFVSRNPHFVVADKDWIQTRYLFIKTSVRHSTGSAAKSIYHQDPQYTAKGTGSQEVMIPIMAISKSRRPTENTMSSRKAKKRKTDEPEVIVLDDSDDSASVATEQDDYELLQSSGLKTDDYDIDDVLMTDITDVFDEFTARSLDRKMSSNSRKRSLESREGFILDSSKTDFVPGSLDTTGIRFLEAPTYASVPATKALMRAFKETVRVQETTPQHDLGFYIDPNRIENVYQWIIELHSFEKTLPLAQDMKKAGITSIVFEIQFTSDFPFSPPFVRVVKPRFLDPMMGGGGHITSGGAICMELLTSSGWSAVNSMESVLLQVRLAMSERERPARLLSNRGFFQTTPYPIGEAIAAYKRFCQKHNWQTPLGLDQLASN